MSNSCSCSMGNEVIEVIEIPKELSELVEKYWYEFNGLKEILIQFTSESTFKPDIDRYLILLNEYIEIFCMYNITYDTIMYKYASKYAGNTNYTASVIFMDHSISISLNDGNSCSSGTCSL